MKLVKSLMLFFAAAIAFSQTNAQAPDTALRLVLQEFKVQNQDLFKKNYLANKAFMAKSTLMKAQVRNGYTSESGRIYTITIFKGLEEFGKYIMNRGTAYEQFAAANPEIDAQNRANSAGASSRSFWRIRDSISWTEPGYNPDKYTFRKLVIYSVSSGKEREYEMVARQMMEVEASLGLKYNSIVYRSSDGYANNVYLRLLPDESRGAYYTHLDARDKAREGNAKLAELRNKLNGLINIIRIDHMNVVK